MKAIMQEDHQLQKVRSQLKDRRRCLKRHYHKSLNKLELLDQFNKLYNRNLQSFSKSRPNLIKLYLN
jgi:uncharacterized membrane-anchored protein YhcB (DUF1043 family)